MKIICKGKLILIKSWKKYFKLDVTYFSYFDNQIKYWNWKNDIIIKLKETDILIIWSKVIQDWKTIKVKWYAYRKKIIN